jgi:hypothetical protein
VPMAGDGSAFAVLGLEPDADSTEIEQAYRRLIKQHHPDREGGDASRAAEINRAYRELRATRHLKEPLQINDHWQAGPSPGRGWMFFALLLAIAAAGVLVLQGPLAPLTQGLASPNLKGSSRARPNQAAPDIMDEPLHLAAIDGAARDALRLSRTRDETALANASRDCHHLLRSSPSMIELDRCAAFDDAVVQLQDRDPLRDQGPFSELAVTGRLWSGATSLSDDSLAIDGRLDRVRVRVELALAGIESAQPR